MWEHLIESMVVPIKESVNSIVTLLNGHEVDKSKDMVKILV